MKTAPSCRVPRLKKREGRCYELAFWGAARAPEWVIVHGECVGPYGLGRMGHAWLEHAGVVYDPVLDKLFDASEYEARVEAIAHARYTYLQACEYAAEARHLGPWQSFEK